LLYPESPLSSRNPTNPNPPLPPKRQSPHLGHPRNPPLNHFPPRPYLSLDNQAAGGSAGLGLDQVNPVGQLHHSGATGDKLLDAAVSLSGGIGVAVRPAPS
jgi:hypothetical protein